MSDYMDFLASKAIRADLRGLDTVPDLAAHLFPFQRECVEASLRVGGAGLFLDCVAGETLIDGPDGARRIDELASRGLTIRVFALNESGKPIIANATAPFRKGTAPLFSVVTTGGLEILATAGHRFLTPNGWTRADEISRGARLLVSGAFHPLTSSECDPSTSRLDGLRSFRTLANSTDGCLNDCRRCGRRLPSVADSGQVFAPSQGDALERDSLLCGEDGPAHILERTHLRRDTSHPSTRGSTRPDCCAVDGAECQPRAFDSARFAVSNQSDPRCEQGAIHLPSCGGVRQAEYSANAGDPCSSLDTSLDTVASVEYIRTDEYFDLHVPRFENYLAQGFWNHNTGLGKTACELEWCRHAAAATNGRALILTPLAVARQIEREGRRWGYEINVIREQSEARDGISVCNYDRLEKLDPSAFGAVALDESSILKSFTGKTTRALIDSFASHRFRLSATATPAPNDHMELGQHAEFCGVMPSNEMLMRWFVTDQTEMGRYRLKHHGVGDFWDWMASWSRAASMPSDLGDSDEGFILPELQISRHRTRAASVRVDGQLFGDTIMSATDMHVVKRKTATARAELAASLIDAKEPWVIWCDTDYESDALMKALRGVDGVAEVRGSHPLERKEETLAAFLDGGVRVIVTKPSCTGWGLNWQHAARTVFVGRSFSYESWYQAVRRLWRFGQKRSVECHVIVAEGEESIGRVIDRKAGDHDSMKREMRAAMRRALETASAVRVPYDPRHDGRLPSWLGA